MPKHLAVQLARNLWIQGDSIISYSTRVAKIQNGKIWMNGRYSRSTTKQMYKASMKLNLPIETHPRIQNFYKFENGVIVKHEFSLSWKTSKEVLPNLKYGLQEALALAKALPKTDLVKVEDWLEKNGESIEHFQRKRELYAINRSLELA